MSDLDPPPFGAVLLTAWAISWMTARGASLTLAWAEDPAPGWEVTWVARDRAHHAVAPGLAAALDLALGSAGARDECHRALTEYLVRRLSGG